jgi:hypothetical protein
MTSREFVISSVRLTEGPLPQPSGDRRAGHEIRSEEDASLIWGVTANGVGRGRRGYEQETRQLAKEVTAEALERGRAMTVRIVDFLLRRSTWDTAATNRPGDLPWRSTRTIHGMWVR